jgi:hypothetical protein
MFSVAANAESTSGVAVANAEGGHPIPCQGVLALPSCAV